MSNVNVLIIGQWILILIGSILLHFSNRERISPEKSDTLDAFGKACLLTGVISGVAGIIVSLMN